MSSTSEVKAVIEELTRIKDSQTRLLLSSAHFLPDTDFSQTDMAQRGDLFSPVRRYKASLMLSDSDGRGRGTAASLVGTESATPSLATSGSRLQCRIFDKKLALSETTASTAPPRRGVQPPQLQRPMVPIPNMAYRVQLPCEFATFSGCEMHFSTNEVDAWIQHIVTAHLQGLLPSYTVCWFCEREFHAQLDTPADRARCYSSRMRHHVEHFLEGVTAAQRRPDFHFLDHIHDHGLIADNTFHLARQETELNGLGVRINTQPPTARCPSSQCAIVIENSHARRRKASSAGRTTVIVKL
ncbi:hypothetical protein HJFPF1_07953 [Paramyrothecium foliicola]|nr:hypothetical protein HJFPF1_07953 [Paramyrothecium foliicola]